MYIGKKIQELRKAKKMSLTDLSRQSGVQMATLSRIENMKMVGTLDSHIQIAKALGLDVTELYKGISSNDNMIDIGPDKKTEVFTHTEGASYDILTKNITSKKMMPTLVRIEENSKTNKEQNKPGTEKFIFVLEGAVKICVGAEDFSLTHGHTLYFDSSLEHHFENTGASMAKIICVCTPNAL